MSVFLSKSIHFSCFLILVLITSACEEDSGNDEPNTDGEISLPVTFDFTAMNMESTSSFERDGVSFGSSRTWNDTGEFELCVEPDDTGLISFNSSSSYPGLDLSFHSVIMDLSDFPAISKVTIHVFNNCGKCTGMSLCDGNDVIKSYFTTDGGIDEHYVLSLDEPTEASTLQIFSLEAILFSITIE